MSLTEFTCVDPKCFVREYPPTLDLLMIDPTLNPGLVALRLLQGIRTSIAKKSYSYVIFREGGGGTLKGRQILEAIGSNKQPLQCHAILSKSSQDQGYKS